jgi:hypothetical protein
MQKPKGFVARWEFLRGVLLVIAAATLVMMLLRD